MTWMAHVTRVLGRRSWRQRRRLEDVDLDGRSIRIGSWSKTWDCVCRTLMAQDRDQQFPSSRWGISCCVPHVGGPPIVAHLQMHIYIICTCLPYSGPFPVPQAILALPEMKFVQCWLSTSHTCEMTSEENKTFPSVVPYLHDWETRRCKTGGVKRAKVLSRRLFCRKCDLWSIC